MLRNRLIALMALILALISISLVGGAASYGFFFFVLIIPLVSFIYSLIVYLRFKVYQRLDVNAAVAGTPAAFYFTLRNEDKFAHCAIKVGFYSDFSDINGVDPEAEYELMPGTGVQKETKLICRYRGSYEVGINTVTVTDYLRLFSIKFRNKEKLRATVLPRLIMLDNVAGLDEVLLAARDSVTQADEPDVLVRDYLPGDDIRRINWKVMAKTGKPMIRKYIGENTPDINIIMEPHRYSDEPAKFLPIENKIIETVLAIAYHCLEQGITTGVYTYDTKLTGHALSSVDSFEDFYAKMSSYRFTKAGQGEMFAEILKDHRIAEGGALILILHKWGDEARACLEQLMIYQIPVMVYLVQDMTDKESDPSDLKSVRFVRIGPEDKLDEVLI